MSAKLQSKQSLFIITSYFFPLLMIGVSIYCGKLLVNIEPIALDTMLLTWFREAGNNHQIVGSAWVIDLWRALTWMGNVWPRVILASVVIGVLILKKQIREGLFLGGLLLSGLLLSTVIKHWVNRPRPNLVPHLDLVSNASFPSGHAMNSTLFYCGLIVILSRYINISQLRWILISIMFSLTIFTGLSRIALGVHYPTDVLAGWLIGASWLIIWWRFSQQYQTSDAL